MNIQWKETACRYLRELVNQVQHLEQTQELRLSDGMPDIGRILCAWGQCVLRGKQWNADHIQASGGITVWALYAPEDGTPPRSVETWLPFAGKWNLPDSKREGTIRVSCHLRDLDVRAVSARKCMVRATVSLQAQAWEMDETTVFTPPEDHQGVQLLQNSYPAMLPVEAGEKLFTLEEPLAVQTQKILCCDVQPVVTEQNAAGNKVVFRGICRAHLVYMQEDGQIRGRYFDLPFAQLAELDRDYDKEAVATVTLAVAGLETELTENGPIVKCTLMGQYMVYDRHMLQLTQDAYSPFRYVEPVQQDLCLPMLLEHSGQNVELQQDLEIPVAEMVDLHLQQEHPAQYREGETVVLELPYHLQALYYDAEGNLRSHSQRAFQRLSVPAGEDCLLQAQAFQARAPEGLLLVDRLRVNGALAVELNAMACQKMPMVTALELGPEEEPDPDRPSLILQRLGSQSLWDVAKACGSTVEAIRRANQLNGDPTDDRMLLIPVL